MINALLLNLVGERVTLVLIVQDIVLVLILHGKDICKNVVLKLAV